MPCFRPDRAWRPKGGKGRLVFSPREAEQPDDYVTLPCRRCEGCALEDARQKACRAKDELSLYDDNIFITLTYSDDFLPHRGFLVKKDFQDFMKRYRKRVFKQWGITFRAMYSGEYGDENWRPHFHAIIFGHDFYDKFLWRVTPRGDAIYRSRSLESLWPWGHCEIASATFESASYVARYTVKKYTNRYKKDFYQKVDLVTGEIYYLPPEFCEYPRGKAGGLGFPWFKKNFRDVFPNDIYIVNGKKVAAPKYYFDKFKQMSPFVSEDVEQKRIDRMRKFKHDNTSERLLVKEQVAMSKSKFFNVKRGL